MASVVVVVALMLAAAIALMAHLAQGAISLQQNPPLQYSETGGAVVATYLDHRSRLVVLFTASSSGAVDVASFDVSGRAVFDSDQRHVWRTCLSDDITFVTSDLSPSRDTLAILYRTGTTGDHCEIVSINLDTGADSLVHSFDGCNINSTSVIVDDDGHFYVLDTTSIVRVNGDSWVVNASTAQDTFVSGIAVGDSIYTAGFGKDNNEQPFLQKNLLANASASSVVRYSADISSTLSYSSAPTLSGVQQHALMQCNGNVYVFISNSETDKDFNAKIFNTSLVQLYHMHYDGSGFETIETATCSPSTGELYLILMDVELSTAYFVMDVYDSSLTQTQGRISLPGNSTMTSLPNYFITADNGAIVPLFEDINTQMNQCFNVPVYTHCTSSEFGPDCTSCTCENGNCDWGELGDGECLSCDSPYYGTNCDAQCVCDLEGLGVECSAGINGNGKCNCSVGATFPSSYTGDYCQHCVPGYYHNGTSVCHGCPVHYVCHDDNIYPCPAAASPLLSVCPDQMTPTNATTPTPTPPTSTTAPATSTSLNYLPVLLVVILLLLILLMMFISYLWYKERLNKRKFWLMDGKTAASMAQLAQPQAVHEMLVTAAQINSN